MNAIAVAETVSGGNRSYAKSLADRYRQARTNLGVPRPVERPFPAPKQMQQAVLQQIAELGFADIPGCYKLPRPVFQRWLYHHTSIRISFPKILATVAGRLGRDPQEILTSRSRRPAEIRPRQIVMYLAYYVGGLAYNRIAVHFGRTFKRYDTRPGREKTVDHSTIMHNVRKIEALMAQDADLRALITRLTEELRQN